MRSYSASGWLLGSAQEHLNIPSFFKEAVPSSSSPGGMARAAEGREGVPKAAPLLTGNPVALETKFEETQD